MIDIKAFRSKKKITQKGLADLLGCTQSFISAVEKGLRPFPEEMLDVLQSKYGDMSDCTTEQIQAPITPQAKRNKPVTLTDESLAFITAGGEAYAAHIVRMMNDKQIAPYSWLEDKDTEIAELNRTIGRLEAELEQAKKGCAQRGENVDVAAVG